MSETSAKAVKSAKPVAKAVKPTVPAKESEIVNVAQPTDSAVSSVKAAVMAAKAIKATMADNSPRARLRTQSVRINRNGTLPDGFKYVARKTMRLNGRTIKPGIDVPEASAWPRVESWVRSGYLDIKEV